MLAFACTDETRAHVHAVYFDSSTRRAAATDGHRLVYAVGSGSLPEPLRPLARVAYDYGWCWAPDGAALFRDIFVYASPAAERFYDRLREKGYVIYPGKLTVADSFRIGCIGHLGAAQINGALKAIAKTIKAMGVFRGHNT